jgi:LPS-assembly protein
MIACPGPPSSAPASRRHTAAAAAFLAMLALAAGLCGAPPPAEAQQALPVEPVDSDEPVVISADDLVFDEALGMVIASGNVEISQGARFLRADRVTYNQRTDIVTATGNIVLAEPTGEIIFADYAELQGDLADGFVRDLGILLTDNSRIAANAGVRRAGRVTEAERGVYSPCEICPEDPDAPPLWQLRAAQITHDTESNDVEYQDVYLDMFGVPVAYTPYLSHPDPTVERRTGFLQPTFGSTSDLGAFAIVPYYIDISPEQDTTIQAGMTARAGPIFLGQYRRRFRNGILETEGSVNRSERLVDDTDPDAELDDRVRGHFFGETRFDLSRHWRVGGRWQVVSDDTYLDIFNISDEDVLRSRGYAEGFYGLSYYAAEAYGFQDLRPGETEQGDIAPVLNANYVSEPGSVLGGQLTIDANALNLIENPEQTRRFTLASGWQREVYSDFGLVTNLSAQIRGDLYWVDDLVDEDDPSAPPEDSFATRFYPYVHAVGRYPLVRQWGDFQPLIEPVAALTASASLDDESDIPNNDSLDVEFDEINLLSVNRFPGFDRVEEGLRATYGLRAALFHIDGGSGSVFLGQSYRFDDDTEFEEGSGLEDNASDIVGRVTIQPQRYVDLDWRFRLSDEDFSARRSEVVARAGIPIFNVSSTYTFIDEIATEDGQSREEIAVRAQSRFADYWSARFAFRRDIAEDENRNISGALTYQDECFTLGFGVVQDLTEDRDRSEGTSVFVTIGFRNLGEPVRLGAGNILDLGGDGEDDS